MFKLLPEEQARIVKREYYFRIIITSLLLLFLATLLASAFLYPIYILSTHKVDVAQATLKAEHADEISSGASTLGPVLAKAKTELDLLGQFQPPVSWYLILGRLINIKPKGVIISSLDLSKGGKTNELSIKFGGVADDRFALLELAKNLDQQSVFSKIVLPVSELAKNKDLSFSLSTTATF